MDFYLVKIHQRLYWLGVLSILRVYGLYNISSTQTLGFFSHLAIEKKNSIEREPKQTTI